MEQYEYNKRQELLRQLCREVGEWKVQFRHRMGSMDAPFMWVRQLELIPTAGYHSERTIASASQVACILRPGPNDPYYYWVIEGIANSTNTFELTGRLETDCASWPFHLGKLLDVQIHVDRMLEDAGYSLRQPKHKQEANDE